MTDGFKVELRMHQRCALSPCLFALVMDKLTGEVSQVSPSTMIVADNIVICESRVQVGDNPGED